MKDVEVYAAVVGAAAGIVALWWAIYLQTREIRAGRADDLRRRLLHAQAASAEAWDVVRNGEPLLQIGAGIAREALEHLSAPSGDQPLARLEDGQTRALIASLGWYRSYRADQLVAVRNRLAKAQSDLTGRLRLISAAEALFVSVLDSTHFPHSFKEMLDRFPANAGQIGLGADADAKELGAVLGRELTDAAFLRFFGEQAAKALATPEGRTYYAVAYHIERFVEAAVADLILLGDRALTRESGAREPAEKTFTADIRHALAESALSDPAKRRLSEIVTQIEDAIPQPGESKA